MINEVEPSGVLRGLSLLITIFFLSACGGSGGGSDSNSDSGLPALSVSNLKFIEGDSGDTQLTFTISLSSTANGEVNVDYQTIDGTATAGSDYKAASGTLTINSGTTSGSVNINVTGDTDFEPNETFILSLSDVSTNAELATSSAIATVYNDDPGGLNDTGITTCGDIENRFDPNPSNTLDCEAVGATATTDGTDNNEEVLGLPEIVPAGQDAHYGRDLTHYDDTNGHAGFSFVKLDSMGHPLVEQSVVYTTEPWDCVLDTVTGLVWEVKTDDQGLRDRYWTYSWYNSDPLTNGGDAGVSNGGLCVDSVNCDTEKYIAAINAAGLCGYSDWRLPAVTELYSLIDSGVFFGSPAIDSDFFPNTNSANYYWSSTPDYLPGSVFRLRFEQSGIISFGHAAGGDHEYVRLVRGN